MATQWISPTWRMPDEQNQSKFENYSLDFDGSNELIQTTDNVGISGSQSRTMSVWIKGGSANNAKQWPMAVNFGAGNTANAMWIGGGPNPGVYWTFGWWGLSEDIYTTIRIDADEDWHMLTSTYNESTQIAKGYLDGVEVASVTRTGINTTDSPLIIGKHLNAATYWDGPIGQLSIFDYTLSETQIKYLFNNNAGGTIPNPQNPMAISGNAPIAYYPLGGSSTGSSSTLTTPNESVPSATVFEFNVPSGGIDRITLDQAITLTGNKTFSAWINLTMAQDASGFMFFGEATTNYYLFIQGDYIYIRDASGLSSAQYTPGFSLNTWYHICISGDGTNLIPYVNGEPISGTYADREMQNENTIGSYSNGTFPYRGEMSNVQIWDTNLSGPEVTTIYNNGVPYTGTQPQAANLKAWYKLNVDTSTWNLTSTSWSITKIGSPYYNGASDGAYAQNGVLRSQDTNSYTIASGDYFQWNSPTIYTSGSDIVLSSSGGEANGQTSGVEIIYQYNIDNTGWTTWHQHADTGTTDQAYAVPSTSPLTVSSNIKIRVQLAGGPNNNSFVDVSDINITGGTSSYSEDFSNVTKYGWFGGSETANPTTTAWIFTDSSGNKNTGTSYGMTTANLVTSDLTRSIPYSSYSMEFDGTDDEVAFASASSGPLNDIGTGDFTVSVWGNATTKADYGTLIGNWSTNGLIMWRVATSNVFECYIGGDGFTTTYTIPFDDTWHHYLIKRSGTDVTVYVDGVSVATGTSSATLASGAISYIGNQPHNSRRWSGKISNPSIYNYAFSENQVLTIYNGGVPNSISSLSPLSWWSLAGDSYFNGNDWICPDLGSGGNNGTSDGMGGTELVGDGPGSTANGIATNMNTPENLQGNAPNSSKNAFSVNMNPADRVEDVAPTP